MSETLWMCDQMRAGQLYARKIFDTQAEAEAFRERVIEAEPDAMFAVVPVDAKQLWN